MLPQPREERTEGKRWEGHKQDGAVSPGNQPALTEKYPGEARLQTPLVLIFLFMFDLSSSQQKPAPMLRCYPHYRIIHMNYDFM